MPLSAKTGWRLQFRPSYSRSLVLVWGFFLEGLHDVIMLARTLVALIALLMQDI